jgi:hypothetical protein
MILDHCLDINLSTHAILYWSAWRHACNLINLSLHLPLSIFYGPKVVAISAFYLLLSKLLSNSSSPSLSPTSLKEQLREFQLFNKECFAWLENLFINCPGSVSISFLPVNIGEGCENVEDEEYIEGSQYINESNEKALAFLLSYCIDK